MRSSLVVRASDCQCTSCNGPGFDPSIRRHSGIWGAADEAVLNNVRTKRKKSPKKIFKKKKKIKSHYKVGSEISLIVGGAEMSTGNRHSTLEVNPDFLPNWFAIGVQVYEFLNIILIVRTSDTV